MRGGTGTELLYLHDGVQTSFSVGRPIIQVGVEVKKDGQQGVKLREERETEGGRFTTWGNESKRIQGGSRDGKSDHA